MNRPTFFIPAFLALIISFHVQAALVDATYIVPPSKGGIPSVSYPLTDCTFVKEDGNPGILKFSLPEDLVGSAVAPLVLTETKLSTPEGLQFAGPNVSAVCATTSVESQLSCKIIYAASYHAIDLKPVVGFLSQKFESDAILRDNKIAMATSFLNDPEGIVILVLNR